MKRLAAFFAIILCFPLPGLTENSSPAELKTLCQTLGSAMNDFNREELYGWSGAGEKTAFAAELLAANSNRGEALLNPNTLKGTALMMDRLKELGCKAVVFNIAHPLSDPAYPKHTGYMEFYRKVTEQAKDRGLKVLIETGYIFPAPYSKLNFNRTGMTFEKDKVLKKRSTELIINEIKPDYITITNEPDTMSALTGLSEYKDPKKPTELVNFVLSGLDRKGVLIGGGAGNWSNPEYFESLCENTSLDYIDLHIYPVNRDFMKRAAKAAEMTVKSGKKLTISEMWLYKAADSELLSMPIAATSKIFGRDAFDLCEPYDIMFFDMMSRFCNKYSVELASFFWSKYLFSYLPYGDINDMTDYERISELSNRAAAKNIVSGTFSPLGLKLKEIAK